MVMFEVISQVVTVLRILVLLRQNYEEHSFLCDVARLLLYLMCIRSRFGRLRSRTHLFAIERSLTWNSSWVVS